MTKITVIDGVIPPSQLDTDITSVPEEVIDTVEATKLPTAVMIYALWERGVDIQQIFGQYYALEAAAAAAGNTSQAPLTVSDAELVGLTGTDQPNDKPF